MATILGLAMKISADATGVQQSLTPVERALQKLDEQAKASASVFTQFAKTSAAAAEAQLKVGTDIEALNAKLKSGEITAKQYADSFAAIQQGAKDLAASFAEGARLADQLRTEEEKRAIQLEKIDALLRAGAITEELAARARAEASGANAAASREEEARLAQINSLQSEAAAITAKYQTDQEKRAAAEARLNALRDAGVLGEESYKRAIDDVTGATQAAAKAEQERSAVLAEGARLTAQFLSADEKRAAELGRIEALVKAGAISEETAARARAVASGEAAAAAAAEKERVEQSARLATEQNRLANEAAAITSKYATEAEKRAVIEADLEQKRAAGLISEETYRRAIDDVSGANAAAAKAEQDRAAQIAAGARITEQFATEEEKRARELENIDALLRAGAITEDIAARAKAEASGVNAAAAKAEQQRAEAVADAARIIRANITPQERYDQQIQELSDHLREGRLSQEQFNRAAAKASQDLDRASKSAGDADKNIERLNRNVSLLTKLEIGRAIVDGLQVLGRAFTSTASQITSLITSVNASLNTLDDFSQRTGIGVESLQGYSLAAKLAGVDTEEFGAAVQRLAVTIGKASPGDALDKSLKEINLSVTELRALSPDQQFSAIGSAISQLPTAADRAAAAVEIFGKQGAALAPLFREGTASIEELQARAERLGVIVDQTQINNVTGMNDAFDLVLATVNGIIGQVTGNLAPAVTDVANQFLEFIETFQGAEGTGGTGIANAITEVLFDGAEYFAGIFDSFMKNFTGISTTLADVGEVFRVGGQLLLSGMEGFRAIFNVIQIGIDRLLVGFGKLLEGIGSWVSEDLEQFGAGLAAAAEESAQKNAREFDAAAANAANSLNAALFGGSAAAAGDGAATEALAAIREKFAREKTPEFKVAANLDDAQKELDRYLKAAGDGADEFLVQSQETLDLFKQQVAQGQLLPQQIQIMNGFMDELNQKLQLEANNRRQARDAAREQSEADRKRVEQLLKPTEEATKLQADLDAVNRRQIELQEQQAAAREAAATAATSSARAIAQAEADSATASLAALDQVKAKLEETQEAAGRGFADGYVKQFEDTAKSIETARQKATQLGEAGLNAFRELTAGAAELEARTRMPGGLDKAQYDAELARLQQFFDERLKREQENQRLIAESKQTANERVEAFLRNSVDARTRAELEAIDAKTKREREAAENLVAIRERIAVTEKALEAARNQASDDRDLRAERARAAELKLLKQQEVQQEKIAAGRQQQQQGFTQDQVAQREQFAKAQDDQYKQALQQQQQLLAERAKAEQAEFERQSARITELNTLGSRTVNTADIRTQEGQALVLGLAANAQDPALIEARLQTKQLQLIAQGIAQASANYFNTPVAIVGGAVLG
jgi:hypothetical protein